MIPGWSWLGALHIWAKVLEFRGVFYNELIRAAAPWDSCKLNGWVEMFEALDGTTPT